MQMFDPERLNEPEKYFGDAVCPKCGSVGLNEPDTVCDVCNGNGYINMTEEDHIDQKESIKEDMRGKKGLDY